MHTYTQMKTDPKRMGHPNADRGLCGFAGTLMALLERRDYGFLDDLYDCVNNATRILGVDKSVRIKGRIQKRVAHGIIPNETSIDDWKACLGFMILFKEHSKAAGDGHWQTCVTFSDLFGGFSYDHLDVKSTSGILFFKKTTTTRYSKLKDLPSTAVLSDKLDTGGLSYKKGDFGVPPSVISEVLSVAGLNVSKTDVVASNAETLKMLTRWSMVKMLKKTFVDAMYNSQTGVSPNDGVLLGVGTPASVRTDLSTYYNVVHWVYVPTVPNSRPNSGDFKVWTWGNEYSAKDLLDSRGMAPVYAVYLAP
ncbi:hypothetical protein [Enhygromyxa salina]|uniref:Uncharacterized protein n=1 Tax=Enhygromyxa salina TaxID=215803 RepID=A0A2S9XT81_9BACT|nr:hypothetical protein [Enhygromyxa salina]PRP96077.1 hypothetical protein ENSA7_68910 [Enhygromyxa salina]